MHPAPDLSVVIVNWNTRDMLRDCLATVMAGHGALGLEVFVIDNGSTDGSPAMLAAEFPQVTCIANADNRGFAAANNQALARARGRHVMLLNTDTLVHGDVLPAAVAYLDVHPQVGVMGPRILNRDGSVQVSATNFPTLPRLLGQTLGLNRIPALDGYRLSGRDSRQTAQVEVISGCAMLVRRAAMDRVGLLDEGFFFYGEETDWCRRFAAQGWQVVFAPVGDITHFGGGSVRHLNHRRDVMLTEGTVRLHRKHGGLAGGIACYALLAAFNASRALLWGAISLTRRPGSADRARHFARVCADFGRAWPRGVQS
ncbi:MAG TPA: glycosyltransferase family 2 protein [Paracoccaceae bacterium]|nr:glycosyltransferase family 2 protein [Paracoccaceae bacterium]